MSGVIAEKVFQAVNTVESLYYKLVLIVGKPCSGKTAVLNTAAADFAAGVINTNLELARALLDLTPKQRVLQLPELFAKLVGRSDKPVFLDNIELIFDQNLKQDPLKLLLQIARAQTMVVAWPGEIRAGKLIYAEANHHEYRSYPLADLVIVQLEPGNDTNSGEAYS